MNINELHDRLYDVLCVIDDICQKHDIVYFLDSGTELGAVRENDFIPWDDDMDIKIKSEDLSKFIHIMEQELPPHMHITMPGDFAPYFYDFIIRIYDDRFLVRNEKDADIAYNNLQNYVGTDVFVISGIPDTVFGRKYAVLKNKILYGMGMTYRYNLDLGKYSVREKLFVKVLNVFGKLSSVEKITKSWIELASKWNGKQLNTCYCCNYSMKHIGDIFPAELYKSSVLFNIRDRKFPVPVGYDKELTMIYGDYMKPPKDKSIFVQHLDPEDRVDIKNYTE